MAEKLEQVKEYEIAFIAKLLESDAVQRGIEELTKGIQIAGNKATTFFESIKKFIPDLGIFNKLLSLAGVSGVLSFGALVSMMPQAARAFARIEQNMRQLARFLGPALEPAFNAITTAVSHFIQKLMETETKYGIFTKIAGGIKWIFDELVRIESKYDVLDKIFGLAGATFDFTIKVASYLDDILPEWLKDALIVGAFALPIALSLVAPILTVAKFAQMIGLGFLFNPATGAFVLTIGLSIGLLAAVSAQAAKLKESLKYLKDNFSEEQINSMGGGLGVVGRAAYQFEGWTRGSPLSDVSNPFSLSNKAGQFVAEETLRMIGFKIVLDERSTFIRIEPDSDNIRHSGGG